MCVSLFYISIDDDTLVCDCLNLNRLQIAMCMATLNGAPKKKSLCIKSKHTHLHKK